MRGSQEDSGSPSACQGHLPSTKEVLCEHVHAIVKAKVPDLSEKVTGMLMECSIKMLTSMLEDENVMNQNINQAVKALKSVGQDVNLPLSEEKQKLGDRLFEKVAEMESELCAQITGMLLEMDISKIKRLLEDSSLLESNVTTARIEYLREHHPGSLPTKEELGEEIYEIVSTSYPEEAARITGMLLELDLEELQRLVDNPDHLKSRIEQAFRAMQETNK